MKPTESQIAGWERQADGHVKDSSEAYSNNNNHVAAWHLEEALRLRRAAQVARQEMKQQMVEETPAAE